MQACQSCTHFAENQPLANDPHLGKQGGSSWARAARFQHIMYGVNNMEESANKMYATIQGQPVEDAVVVLAHNGRSGFGSQQHDICGKDWSDKAGECLLSATYTLHQLLTSSVQVKTD